MSRWNAHHYARAEEFLRILADTVANAPRDPAPASTPLEKPEKSVAPPRPAPTPAPVPSGATAKSVFNKIPWKK